MLLKRNETQSLIAASLVGALIVFVIFYPGYLSFDPIHQLMAARKFEFSDHHPPTMALIWRLLDRVWPGPAPMLLLQNLVYWMSSAALLSKTQFSFKKKILYLFALGLLPPYCVYLGTVWKDVQMGVFLLASLACFQTSHSNKQKIFWLLGVICLFYGMSVRHNGIVAGLPICIFAMHDLPISFDWKRLKSRTFSLCAGLALALSLVSLIQTIPILVGAKKMHLWQIIALHDFSGASVVENQLIMPSFVTEHSPQLTLERVKLTYRPYVVDVMIHPNNPDILDFDILSDPSRLKELKSAWLELIVHHPIAYLKHRWGLTAIHAGITGNVYYPFHPGIDANELGIELHPSLLNKIFMKLASFTRNGLLCRIWFYWILLISGFIYSWRKNLLQPLTQTLFASVFMYEASNFFVMPAADLRYSWWTMMITPMLMLLILNARIKQTNADKNSSSQADLPASF